MNRTAAVALLIGSLSLSACGVSSCPRPTAAPTTTAPATTTSTNSITPPAPSYGWVQAQAVRLTCPKDYPNLIYLDNHTGILPFSNQTQWYTEDSATGQPSYGCSGSSRTYGVQADCAYDPSRVAIGYRFSCNVNQLTGNYPHAFYFTTPVNGQWGLSEL